MFHDLDPWLYYWGIQLMCVFLNHIAVLETSVLVFFFTSIPVWKNSFTMLFEDGPLHWAIYVTFEMKPDLFTECTLF